MEDVKDNKRTAIDRAVQIHRAGNLAEAERAYRALLEQFPDDGDLHNNLGVLLKAQRRFPEAEQELRQAIQSDPHNFSPWGNMANLFKARGRTSDGMTLLNNQAQRFLREGRRDLAYRAYRHALSMGRDNAELRSNLANLLIEQEKLEEAEVHLRRALELRPDYPRAMINLGNLLVKLGRIEEAEEQLRKAVDQAPDQADVLHDYAIFLKLHGRLEEAKPWFRKALALRPDFIPSLIEFSQLERYKSGDGYLEALEELVARDDQNLPRLYRVGMTYALANSYNNEKRYDEAFEMVGRGSRLHRQSFTYSADDMDAYGEHIRRTFTPALFERLKGVGDPDETSVFVLGMPRSGTTLTDQIVVSHPQAESVGETETIRGIWNSFLAARAKPLNTETICAIPPALFAEEGRKYVAQLRQGREDALRIVEKEPSNFMRVGFIHLMLPRARILHCVRNPIDTCVSCYFLKFHGAAQPFSYDLADLGRFYRLYLKTMDHWRQVLPETVFDVVYEETVADQEGQSRRILDHLGLPWDDRVLSFHKTDRAVRTNSLAQVRRPIYTDSLERWRRYEKHLGPLLDALGDDVLERFGISR